MIATGPDSGPASSGRKSRPTSGRCPITKNVIGARMSPSVSCRAPRPSLTMYPLSLNAASALRTTPPVARTPGSPRRDRNGCRAECPHLTRMSWLVCGHDPQVAEILVPREVDERAVGGCAVETERAAAARERDEAPLARPAVGVHREDA